MSSTGGARYIVKVEQNPRTREKPRIIALFASYGATRFETAKGLTLVHFAQAEAAQRLIDEQDGRLFGGAEVSVCWYTASLRPGNEILVRFLPFEVSIRAIRELFAQYGRLTNVHIVRDRSSGQQEAHAYVKFVEEAEAEAATNALDGFSMSRGPIRITWAMGSSPPGYLVRIVGLAESVDRNELQKFFGCYGGLRCVQVDYDLATGHTN